MEEKHSWKRDLFELAFGVTIVCVAMPFVFVELTIEKVKVYRDLLKQIESNL